MNSVSTYKLIEKIDDLSVAKMFDCICEQNFSVLILSGTPSEIDLLECWSNLYAQYLDVLGDTETLYIIMLQRDVALLNLKITAIEGSVGILNFLPVESLIDALRKLGFDVRNLTEGNPGYDHALKRILSKLAPMKLKLEEMQAELTQFFKDRGEDTVSRDQIRRQVTRLSKFMGYPIKTKKTMVPEYVGILKEYLSQFSKPEKEDNEDATSWKNR
jgi:hypothetical protein